MAGAWLYSLTIKELKQKTQEYASDQYEFHLETKEKLNKLEKHLEAIQAIISAVPEMVKVEGNPAMVGWLDNLRDVIYDAADILEFLEYRDIIKQVNFSSSKKDDGFENLDTINLAFEKLHNVKKYFKHLMKVEQAAINGRQDEVPAIFRPFRQTVSGFDKMSLFGRDMVMKQLVKVILVILTMSVKSTASINLSNDGRSIISIYGIGGIGKTALAQSIYHEVKEKFKFTAWVYVSQRFHPQDVTKGLLEFAYRDEHENMPACAGLAAIQDHLEKKLKNKRFLIVLDGIWYDDDLSSKWESLSAPFKSGLQGSIVITTSRDERVGPILGSTQNMRLKGLEDEDFWELFTSCAFGCNVKPKAYLEHMGNKIADELDHWPLAAIAIRDLLKLKPDKESFLKDILEDPILKIDEKCDNRLMKALESSYLNLPLHLKQCFCYCSIFPKKYNFGKDELISSWMALGYLRSDKKRPEDVGKDYFEELAHRGFLHKEDDKWVIQNLFRDLVASNYGGGVCLVENESKVIPETVRHIFITCDQWDNILGKIERSEKVRSLVILPKENRVTSSGKLNAMFKKFKGLRILILPKHWNANYKLRQPLAIGKMFHLRYLAYDLACHDPVSLFKLHYLQTIQFYNSGRYQNLPEGLSKLINLRKIDADYQAISRLPRLGQLKMLQELRRYEVTEEEGHSIEELESLQHIRGSLEIVGLDRIANNAKKSTREILMENKKDLKELALEWNYIGVPQHGKTTLEGLQPHSNLQVLRIRGYGGGWGLSWLGGTRPSLTIDRTWLSSFSLCEIELHKCHLGVVLPALGELPYLERLKLSHMPRVNKIGARVFGEDAVAFPSLEELSLEYMPDLSEWSPPQVANQEIFPSIKRILVKGCPMLNSLPMLPGSLEKPHLRHLLQRFHRKKGG